MAELTENTIELLSRALLAQLTPITGERAAGVVTASAPGPDPITVPRNTYMIPVVRGHLRPELVFKTLAEGVVPGGGTLDLAVTSNIGGARHNVADETVFRFDPPVPGLAPTATARGDFTGGSNVGALLRNVQIFEDVDATNVEEDFFASMMTDPPAAVLSWQQTEQAEGEVVGLRRGASRATRSVVLDAESFVLYVIVARIDGPGMRRKEGQVIAQAATRCWRGRMKNIDGEQLMATGGGVAVVSRARVARAPKHYVYAVRLRAIQSAETRVDGRTFTRWERTNIQGALPGREAPEPTDALTIVDDTEDMA